MGRAEPGRLDATRRLERILPRRHADGSKLGPLDAVLTGSMQAWRATRFIFRLLDVMLSAASGSKKSSILGRATHFVQRETQGSVHILHEDFSVRSRRSVPLIRCVLVRPSS